MQTLMVVSVEDSDCDFFIIENTLRGCLQHVELRRALDGEQALKLLEGFVETKPEDHPRLVILDVNLPRASGMDVLQFMKAQPLLSSIPVVMFTSSANPKEKARALSLGAQEYLTKTSDLDSMVEQLGSVCVRYLPHVSKPELH